MSFDDQLRERLLSELGDNEGREFASVYDQAQAYLRNHVYSHIQGQEPQLTDHGATHVDNVKRNVTDLLSNDGEIVDLSAIEIYCIGLCILFHDAAIIHGRKNHQHEVAKVFDRAIGENVRWRLSQRQIVLQVTRAHTGLAQDGTADTLKQVDELSHLLGKSIRTQALAAVLRFADELAEGPQRTSEYMAGEGLYSTSSGKFHDYATSANVAIQRNNRRIVLAYQLEVIDDYTVPNNRRKLKKQLEYTYGRIMKLDQERRYTRFYTDLLDPFRVTEVTFHFHLQDSYSDLNLTPLRLTDLVLPGEHQKSIDKIDEAYSIDALIDRIIDERSEA